MESLSQIPPLWLVVGVQRVREFEGLADPTMDSFGVAAALWRMESLSQIPPLWLVVGVHRVRDFEGLADQTMDSFWVAAAR